MKQSNPVSLRPLVQKWSLPVAILFVAAKTLQFLRRMGFTPREDGWRRATRAFFRAENSKFVLTAFCLDVYSEQIKTEDQGEVYTHLLKRIGAFLKKHPETGWQLKWGWHFAYREKKRETDVIWADFSEDGSLLTIKPYLDPDFPVGRMEDPGLRQVIHQTIMGVYNGVNHCRDRVRPYRLCKRLHQKIRKMDNLSSEQQRAAIDYAERILSGTFVHFEEVSELKDTRLTVPDFTIAKHPGLGLFNIRCRLSGDRRQADIWVQVSHILMDGVPVQEMLTELKQEWGAGQALMYPAIIDYSPRMTVTSSPASKEKIYQAVDLIDFRPLLAERKMLNQLYAVEVGGEITVLSLLAWNMAHFPAFYGRKFQIPVDLAAVSQRDRTVGLVFIRPGEYFNHGNYVAGFLGFQREFNRRLSATRERKSESYELAESFALTPPHVHSLVSRLFPSALAEFTGTVGLSIVKEAEVVLGPVSDLSHPGYLAVGNYLYPAEDGAKVGAVSVSGTLDRVTCCLRDLRDAVKKVPLLND